MLKGVTLRGLEVFEALAAHGSVALAAEATGMSQPAVSQQLSNLEKALDATLVERGRRPMRLTPAGRGYLARCEIALRELRMGQSELTVTHLSELPALHMGLIDDFDNDLTPRLVTELAHNLTKCQFKLITAPSREISRAMTDGVYHLAVGASTGETLDGVVEYPLARDPFILVTPASLDTGPGTGLDDLAHTPFLRYAADQLIAQQVEAILVEAGHAPEHRFEIGSHPALMAMVAQGIGWSLTTPLGYMRAVRYHDQIQARPLTFSDASRTIALFARDDVAPVIPTELAETMRRLIGALMVDPAIERLPWLAGELAVIDG